MALNIKLLFAPTVLGTNAGTLFTNDAAPASLVLKNGRMRFTNTDPTLAHNVTAYAIPSGGVAGPANCFVNNYSISPNSQPYDVDIPEMGPGGFVQAKADGATAVTVFALDGTIFT